MRRVIVVIILALIVVIIWSFYFLTGPPTHSASYVTFAVREGEGVKVVSNNLHREELIRSPLLFRTYLWIKRAEGSLQAGVYRFPKNSDLFTIANVLMGGADPQLNRITLIEGWTLVKYSTVLAAKGFDDGAFDDFTASATVWKERYDFLSGAPAEASLEGYLFPDTYAAGADRNVESLITKMLGNFNRKLTASMRADISKSDFSIHEMITLASIIENEISRTEDRRLVSDIFRRRLSSGMPLQSDATINYITGSGRTRSTAEDLKIDSPYNTYKYRGLPPGPIGNPGLDAIEAAIYPEANDYYYFLTDDKGNIHYAKTFEEHQENREKYL